MTQKRMNVHVKVDGLKLAFSCNCYKIWTKQIIFSHQYVTTEIKGPQAFSIGLSISTTVKDTYSKISTEMLTVQLLCND